MRVNRKLLHTSMVIAGILSLGTSLYTVKTWGALMNDKEGNEHVQQYDTLTERLNGIQTISDSLKEMKHITGESGSLTKKDVLGYFDGQERILIQKRQSLYAEHAREIDVSMEARRIASEKSENTLAMIVGTFIGSIALMGVGIEGLYNARSRDYTGRQQHHHQNKKQIVK